MNEEPKTLTKEIAEEFLADPYSVQLDIFTKINDAAAWVLAGHGGSLSLDGLTELSDAAAQALAERQAEYISLDGLTELSDAAAVALAGCRGELYLNSLTMLSDAAAEALAVFQGERLESDSLQRRLPPPVETRSTWSCAVSPAKLLPSGTRVRLPGVWAFTDRGQTRSFDIEFTLEEPMSLLRALAALEEKALEQLKAAGADEMRHYYIEGVDYRGDLVVFDYGT
jgi:hypothetical protein